MLERAPGSGLRIVVAAPPQHGKSETSIHAFAWWLKKNPELRNAYATYAQTRSDRVARKARSIAERAGIRVSGPTRAWTTAGGGGVIWTSVGGALTGEPVDGVLLVDDPYKDRKHADSAAYSDQVMDWLDDVAETRVHPGASIIVMATRWQPKDLSGTLVKRGWQYLNIKAIADGRDQPPGDDRLPGEPLCPERKPLAELLRLQKVNPFSFASLFQGEPRPRDGQLFGSPHYYDPKALPKVGIRHGYGLDFSYSAKTSSDWSVLVHMLAEALELYGPDGKKLYRFYVIGVVRRQVQAPVFAKLVKEHMSKGGQGGRAFWRASSTELGTLQFMRTQGLRVAPLKIEGDKFHHAQKLAEAWNDGRVLVPSGQENAEWVEAFVDELQSFTGAAGKQDDQVDGAVCAFDGLSLPPASYDSKYDDYLPGMRI